ncbi:MAG TPA: Holliday junction branch migration protein RuvA [Chloroflexota bacterium]|nr:Holliday junction branch migration protein RuvA [Chloroflexota bacterium]
MIAGLHGTVEEIGGDFLLINVGGVVYQTYASSATLSSVSSPGAVIHLHTHLQVREDGMTLFGFASREELRMFQLLLSVSGVGPRIALALLSTMSVEDLIAAIAAEDTARLSTVTGVGKRTAARIALELKAKVGQAQVAAMAASPGNSAQLLDTLTALGYSSTEAASAVRAIPHLQTMELEDALREALRWLSSAR